MKYFKLSPKQKIIRICIMILLLNAIADFSRGIIKGWNFVEYIQQTHAVINK